MAVLVSDFIDHELFYDNNNSAWSKQIAIKKRAEYDNMINDGRRIIASVNAINRWIDKAIEKYNPTLTAYNIAFDSDKCQKSGIDLTGFNSRFCLWHTAAEIFGNSKNFKAFALENHYFGNRTKNANMVIKTNAEVMAHFVTGNNNHEPHTALEDAQFFELPILSAIVKCKYVICNADEGEPGTFKDRLILEGDPHKLIEGMVIAGYAIGSWKGYIYIRGEYDLSIRRMQKAIDQARQSNLLGKNILETGFSFDLEIKKGAGAYVCGEETALIESLEGKRGNPRLKPPYPVTHGLWQKPTLVNNVETLANVPEILFHGSDWFRKFGTEKCPGTKVFTILGHVETPGLIRNICQ